MEKAIINHAWICSNGHIIGEDFKECAICVNGSSKIRKTYKIEIKDKIEENKEDVGVDN